MTLRTIISCNRYKLRRLKSIEFRRNDSLFSSDGQHIYSSCQSENADYCKTYDAMRYKCP